MQKIFVPANIYFSYFDLLELMPEKVASAACFRSFPHSFYRCPLISIGIGHRSIVSFCINDATSADSNLEKLSLFLSRLFGLSDVDTT